MRKNINLNFYLLNIIFMTFPVSLILGNFAVNLNILILFLLASINFIINKDKISLNLNNIDKTILIFFSYTLITLLINYYEKILNYSTLNENVIIKTFFFQRYLILYFLVRILIEKKLLKVNWFCLSCALCVSFLILDVLFQFLFGKNFFGMQPYSTRHFSGVFGEELIAGGYIQKFYLFILILLSFLKIKKPYVLICTLTLIFITIILSGNRMPLILFILSLIFLTLFYSKLKKYFFKLFLILFTIFFIIFNTNNNFKIHFINLYNEGLFLVTTPLFKDLSSAPALTFRKPYVVEFYCSKTFIKESPILGGGIRSYRTHPGGCLTHSHNYYLEILVDLGVVGLTIILFALFFLVKKIKSLLTAKKKIPQEIIPFLIILITEFFPFRTSGSFFSTGNAVVIFIFLSVVVSSISFKINTKK